MTVDRAPGAEVAPGALLFDFDGLICDTERAGHRAWQEIYGECGLEFPSALWRSMVGRADGEQRAAEHLAERVGGSAEGAQGGAATPAAGASGPSARFPAALQGTAALVARRKALKHELCAREPLRPGVRALLDAARAAGVPAAVVSSAPHAWVAPHLERLGVRGHFVLLATGGMTARNKPHPDLYELALSRLGCDPAHAVAFEDSAIGVRAARAAGVRCVAVPNGVGDPAELAHADAVLTSLADYDLSGHAATRRAQGASRRGAGHRATSHDTPAAETVPPAARSAEHSRTEGTPAA
ncbi:HAD family hydrolase [Streptomyces iconiensis]|uniref:HAD-IA family hydrolase n=1 Tax=Streptomyces iconiensis TaxID=1384038 RepID=A0ABT6ZVT9_9ACTN|nr:HAD-IA family hydrolase [Streptomyces iconiensis]MDJ1132746.1 HAD-IA family hydrolase [Streptomyces iconiensis]